MLPRPPPSTLFPYTTLFRSTVWICVQRGDSGRAERRTDCPPAAAEILMGYPGGRAVEPHAVTLNDQIRRRERQQDRKSTRLNSSHVAISYAVFCLKNKTIAS